MATQEMAEAVQAMEAALRAVLDREDLVEGAIKTFDIEVGPDMIQTTLRISTPTSGSIAQLVDHCSEVGMAADNIQEMLAVIDEEWKALEDKVETLIEGLRGDER